jgi:hypothetical protein
VPCALGAGVLADRWRPEALCRVGRPAILRVTLLNKGNDAFEPETYGPYITVERRLER